MLAKQKSEAASPASSPRSGTNGEAKPVFMTAHMREEKRQNRQEKMAQRAKERRDLWIGHKLGNMITDVKIDKRNADDALRIQRCFHEGCVPLVQSCQHNFRMSARRTSARRRKVHQKRFVNSGNLEVFNSKQDITCDKPIEEKQQRTQGFVRQRDILREVATDQFTRLHKLKVAQQRLKDDCVTASESKGRKPSASRLVKVSSSRKTLADYQSSDRLASPVNSYQGFPLALEDDFDLVSIQELTSTRQMGNSGWNPLVQENSIESQLALSRIGDDKYGAYPLDSTALGHLNQIEAAMALNKKRSSTARRKNRRRLLEWGSDHRRSSGRSSSATTNQLKAQARTEANSQTRDCCDLGSDLASEPFMDPKDFTLRLQNSKPRPKDLNEQLIKLWRPNKEVVEVEPDWSRSPEKIEPFYPTTTTTRLVHDERNAALSTTRMVNSEKTCKALRHVPIKIEDDKSQQMSEEEDPLESPNLPLHPMVNPFQPFKYTSGKPDRVKKVKRFFQREEEKMHLSEQRKVEILIKQDSEKKALEADQSKHKIYFGSIKSRVPKLAQSQAQLDRRKKLQDQTAEYEEKTGKPRKQVTARGSGNLAAAIGLYKSGQNLEKIAKAKRLSFEMSQKMNFGAIDDSQRLNLIRRITTKIHRSTQLSEIIDCSAMESESATVSFLRTHHDSSKTGQHLSMSGIDRSTLVQNLQNMRRSSHADQSPGRGRKLSTKIHVSDVVRHYFERK